MKKFFISIFGFLFCASVFAQSDLERISETEKAFERAAAENGMRSAFLEFLADDSVIFHPNAVNGKLFWKAREDSSPARIIRNATYADIAANGLLGYTTGNWELYPDGTTKSPTQFGQYVTVWEKKPDGKYRATVDIGITHEKLSSSPDSQTVRTNQSRELNKRGWSAADPSMNFLRMSMSQQALSGAYEKFAANDVRLLIERAPPITGKKNVVSATKHYMSVEFPAKLALYESADMAYVWNACEFADSNEGTEKGNCLHIWKFRNKKWWIVLGVFAPLADETLPRLKIGRKNKESQ